MTRRQVVSSPEASCHCVVVVIDVGDDFGEPYDAALVRGYGGSSSHAEGRPLLGSGNPAATETTQ